MSPSGSGRSCALLAPRRHSSGRAMCRQGTQPRKIIRNPVYLRRKTGLGRHRTSHDRYGSGGGSRCGYPPRLDACDNPLGGFSEARDDSVAFFVAFTEFSTGWRFSRSDEATSSTIFVADPGARVADDLGNRCSSERFSIMGAPRKRVVDAHGFPVEQADHLGVEPGRAVLAAPQFLMAGVGPARCDGAVHQASPALNQIDSLLGSGHELLQYRPHDRRKLRHDTRHSGLRNAAQITQKLLRTVPPKIRTRDLHCPKQPTQLRATNLISAFVGELPSAWFWRSSLPAAAWLLGRPNIDRHRQPFPAPAAAAAGQCHPNQDRSPWPQAKASYIAPCRRRCTPASDNSGSDTTTGPSVHNNGLRK
jgi:hypothetical protein